MSAAHSTELRHYGVLRLLYSSSKMTDMATRTRASEYVNLADAKARLSELVDRAAVGEDVIIARDHKPIAKLTAFRPLNKPRKPGSAKGQVWIAPDFDEIPTDFDDYAS